ncbi:hypothetical protein LCGC14_2233250 [marine sediment metagenome]|uniref:HTH cro/C1-type domain-containing protein n=1 Tax=marine sediment metagenome TaxID=412755 RepID=A0A0F9FK40_9ZZZZ
MDNQERTVTKEESTDNLRPVTIIRKLREAKGMSILYLAGQSKMSPSTIRSAELDIEYRRVSDLRRIAEVLEVPLGVILAEVLEG